MRGFGTGAQPRPQAPGHGAIRWRSSSFFCFCLSSPTRSGIQGFVTSEITPFSSHKRVHELDPAGFKIPPISGCKL